MLGRRTSDDGDEWCVASEDCAFGPIGFQRVRDVLPGEMIVITEDGEPPYSREQIVLVLDGSTHALQHGVLLACLVLCVFRTLSGSA